MTEAEIDSLDHIVNDEMDYWDFYLSDEGESFKQGFLVTILNLYFIRITHSGAPSATRSGRHREYASNDLYSIPARPDTLVQFFHLTYTPPILMVILQGLVTSLNNQIGRETQIHAPSTRIRRRGALSRLLASTGRTSPWICSSHGTPRKRRPRQQRMPAKSLTVPNKRSPITKRPSTIHSTPPSLTACLTRLWIKTKRSRFPE